MRTDLSHLPPSTPEEIRAMTRRAGLDLPEELMQQFITAWPAFEAMVRPRRRAGAQLSATAHRARLRLQPPPSSYTRRHIGGRARTGSSSDQSPSSSTCPFG